MLLLGIVFDLMLFTRFRHQPVTAAMMMMMMMMMILMITMITSTLPKRLLVPARASASPVPLRHPLLFHPVSCIMHPKTVLPSCYPEFRINTGFECMYRQYVVCIDVRIHLHAYTYTHIHSMQSADYIDICTYKHAYKHTHIYAYIHTYILIYIHTYIHTCIHT